MQQPRRLFPALLLEALWRCELCAGRELNVARTYQQQGGLQSLAMPELKLSWLVATVFPWAFSQQRKPGCPFQARAVALGPCGTAAAPSPSRPP